MLKEERKSREQAKPVTGNSPPEVVTRPITQWWLFAPSIIFVLVGRLVHSKSSLSIELSMPAPTNLIQ